MEQKLIFTGFHDFLGKDKQNHYYVLDFISQPKISQDGTKGYVANITIFTEEKKYFDFIKNHKLLDLTNVNYEINGDKVRYFI